MPLSCSFALRAAAVALSLCAPSAFADNTGSVLEKAAAELPGALQILHQNRAQLTRTQAASSRLLQSATLCTQRSNAQQRELAAETKLLGPAKPKEPTILVRERRYLTTRAIHLEDQKGICEAVLLQASRALHRAHLRLKTLPAPSPTPPLTAPWLRSNRKWLLTLAPGAWPVVEQQLAHQISHWPPVTAPRGRGWLAGVLLGGLLAFWLGRRLRASVATRLSWFSIGITGPALGWAAALNLQAYAETPLGWLGLLLAGGLAIWDLRLRLRPMASRREAIGWAIGISGLCLWFAARIAPIAGWRTASASLTEMVMAVGLLVLIQTIPRPLFAGRIHTMGVFLVSGIVSSLLLLPWWGYPYLAELIWPIFLEVLAIALILGLLTQLQLAWWRRQPEQSTTRMWLSPALMFTWLGGLGALLLTVPVPQTTRQVLNALMSQGFHVGSLQIDPLRWMAALLLLLVVLGLNQWLSQVLERSPYFATFLPTGTRHALLALLRYLGIALALLLAIAVAGLGFHNVALIAGALSVGIGFGLQNIVANFLAGLVLLFERPIKPGDWISVDQREGYVQRVSFRSTVLKAIDGSEIFIPNSEMLSTPVVNWMHTDTQALLEITLGVGYSTDPTKLGAILLALAEADPDLVSEPPHQPQVLFLRFGAYALEFALRVYVHDVSRRYTVASRLHTEILMALRKAGIELPYPRQVLEVQAASALPPQVQESTGTPVQVPSGHAP